MSSLPLHPLLAWAVVPVYLWAGLGLASIPIIIHLLNRRRFRIVRWAAMEYLLQALRKNRRRLRFEQLLLLFVRCSLLVVLGLALAQPKGCTDNTTVAALGGRRPALHVFVIDNSYSMGYEADRPKAKTHLDQARLLARQQLDTLTDGTDQVAVVLASRLNSTQDASERVVLRPTDKLAAAQSAIERIEQSYRGTDLLGACSRPPASRATSRASTSSSTSSPTARAARSPRTAPMRSSRPARNWPICIRPATFA